jgi:hypothetical protein
MQEKKIEVHRGATGLSVEELSNYLRTTWR